MINHYIKGIACENLAANSELSKKAFQSIKGKIVLPECSAG
jgi:hypothetical protein